MLFSISEKKILVVLSDEGMNCAEERLKDIHNGPMKVSVTREVQGRTCWSLDVVLLKEDLPNVTG